MDVRKENREGGGRKRRAKGEIEESRKRKREERVRIVRERDWVGDEEWESKRAKRQETEVRIAAEGRKRATLTRLHIGDGWRSRRIQEGKDEKWGKRKVVPS